MIRAIILGVLEKLTAISLEEAEKLSKVHINISLLGERLVHFDDEVLMRPQEHR